MQETEDIVTRLNVEAESWGDADSAGALCREAASTIATLRAEVETWQKLYRRAINEANGLTNYVEDRPELRGAEKRIDRIEQEARAAIDAAKVDKEGTKA